MAYVVTVMGFILGGIVVLVYPRRVQTYMLRYYERHVWLAGLNPFRWWIRTDSYVWTLRLIGVIAIAGGVYLLSFAGRVLLG